MTAFLVDQQLPSRLASHLRDHGQDARHVKQYPGGTTLGDAEIAAIADREGRTVVTKDDDFRILHFTRKRPARLLTITCGNIATSGLLALHDQHFTELKAAIDRYRFVELHPARGLHPRPELSMPSICALAAALPDRQQASSDSPSR